MQIGDETPPIQFCIYMHVCFFHVFSLHLHFYLYLYHKSFHANWWTGWLARARQIGIVGGILVNNSWGHAQDDAYLFNIHAHYILVPIEMYWITCSHSVALKNIIIRSFWNRSTQTMQCEIKIQCIACILTQLAWRLWSSPWGSPLLPSSHV